MRTIKASEVRKGMRVVVVREFSDAKVTTEGVACSDYGTGPLFPLTIGDQPVNVGPNHPVTVLAEPEPEWVEGAWYALDVGGHRRPGRRVKGGWSSWADGPTHGLSDDDELTVLGRVLIVDWPGDDVARELETNGGHHNGIGLGPINKVCRAVADAIRTQGGVR